MSRLSNDVFLNSTPHLVQTSELTKNAVNPRNIFMETEKASLDDATAEFAAQPAALASTVQFETTSSDVTQQALSQPEIKDSYDTHTSLSVPKTHMTSNVQAVPTDKSLESQTFFESLHQVEDRIQSLRKKHPSKNIQSLGHHEIHDNIQALDKTSYSDNRQLISEKVVGDNFQKLSPAENRRDHMVYKEKKNILENMQHVDAHPPLLKTTRLDEPQKDETQANGYVPALSASNEQPHQAGLPHVFVEDELAARVRKMKEKIGKVNQSLTDFEENKDEASK